MSRYRIIQVQQNKYKIQKLYIRGFIFKRDVWEDLGRNYFRSFIITYYRTIEEAKTALEKLEFKERVVYEI